MNYYYDIFLNFNEDYWMFYEWDKNDSYDFIKRIPLLLVSDNAFKDLLINKVRFKEEFIKEIENKTIMKKNKRLEYAFIVSDGKNSLGIELNKDGNIINKSSLLLEDELNINEFIYGIDMTNLKYDIISKDSNRSDTKQNEKIKRVLELEIKDMYENNDTKLKYVYLEWFGELCDDKEKIYNRMIERLNTTLEEKDYQIYELLKIAYNV